MAIQSQRLRRDAKRRDGTSEGLLANMPAGNRRGFFSRQHWEHQLRKARFPRERFGFVQGEVEHMFMLLDPATKLVHNLFADAFELGQKFTAGGDATDAEIHLWNRFSIFNFILHNVYPSSSCLFSQI